MYAVRHAPGSRKPASSLPTPLEPGVCFHGMKKIQNDRPLSHLRRFLKIEISIRAEVCSQLPAPSQFVQNPAVQGTPPLCMHSSQCCSSPAAVVGGSPPRSKGWVSACSLIEGQVENNSILCVTGQGRNVPRFSMPKDGPRAGTGSESGLPEIRFHRDPV